MISKQQLTIFYIVELRIRTDTRQSVHGKQISIEVWYFVKMPFDFKETESIKNIIVCIINCRFFDFHSLSGHYHLPIAHAGCNGATFIFYKRLFFFFSFICLCVLPLDLFWDCVLLR